MYKESHISMFTVRKELSKTYDLKKHMMTRTVERLHSCTRCSMRFTSTSSLKLHIMIHTGEKPHSCLQREKRYIQAWSLKQNMMTHTRNEMTCE